MYMVVYGDTDRDWCSYDDEGQAISDHFEGYHTEELVTLIKWFKSLKNSYVEFATLIISTREDDKENWFFIRDGFRVETDKEILGRALVHAWRHHHPDGMLIRELFKDHPDFAEWLLNDLR